MGSHSLGRLDENKNTRLQMSPKSGEQLGVIFHILKALLLAEAPYLEHTGSNDIAIA